MTLSIVLLEIMLKMTIFLYNLLIPKINLLIFLQNLF